MANKHLAMVLETLEFLPPAVLPEGYRFRPWEDAMVGDYARVINECFPGETHTHEGDMKKEGYDRFQTIMIYHGDEPVAAASAVANIAGGSTRGYLHFVAARSSHKGKRLGLAVCSAALRLMRGWGMTSCLLDTRDNLLPAIVTYFKLGFKPVPVDDDYAARWRAVIDLLKSKGFQPPC